VGPVYTRDHGPRCLALNQARTARYSVTVTVISDGCQSSLGTLQWNPHFGYATCILGPPKIQTMSPPSIPQSQCKLSSPESEPKVKELLIGTLVDLPTELPWSYSVFASYEDSSVPKIAWLVRSFTDFSTKDRVTGDQAIQGAKYSWFDSHPEGCAFICYLCTDRVVIL